MAVFFISTPLHQPRKFAGCVFLISKKFLVERHKRLTVADDTARGLVSADQIAALAAGQADPLRVDAAIFDDLVGKIRVSKGHAAEQHTIAQALLDRACAEQISIGSQVSRCRCPNRHFRHGLFHCANAVDHAGQANKRMFVRFILAKIEGAGHMGRGIGVAHRQVDHIQAQFVVQIAHQADGFSQIGRHAALRTDTEAPRVGVAVVDADARRDHKAVVLVHLSGADAVFQQAKAVFKAAAVLAGRL